MTYEPPTFSLRDHDTGWDQEVIRRYVWRLDGTHKHAGSLTAPGQTICGQTLPRRVSDTLEGRIAYFSAVRCWGCLKAIGADLKHPYRYNHKPSKSTKAPSNLNRDFVRPDAEHLAKFPEWQRESIKRSQGIVQRGGDRRERR